MTRIVEVSAQGLGAVRDDVARTRDRIDDELDALRRRAAWLGVPTAGFDGALDVRDRLGSTVLPVLDAHVRRAQDLEAARYPGMGGMCLAVVDDDPWPDPPPGFSAMPAFGEGTVLTWDAAPAQEEAADHAEAQESRGIGGWFADRWDDVSDATGEGLDWLGERAGEAWDGISEAGAAIGDWWESVTADLGGWLDTELADLRSWIGEHVAVFRFVASAFRVVGWVLVAVGAVLTVGLAIIGAMGGAGIGAVFGFGVGAVPGGAAGAAAGAAFGLKVLGAGFTLVSIGDFLDVAADWGEGTIDGQQLVQRGALEIGFALTAFLGAGALGKTLQKLVEHLPASVRGRLDGWIERLLRRGDDVGDDVLEGGARHADDGVLPVGDGTRRELYDQVTDPHVHPSNAEIIPPGYDPYGGWGDAEAFAEEYLTVSPAGKESWAWPPNDGALPGSEQVRQLGPGDALELDRVGGLDGEYFSPEGTPFDQRALPPDRLNFERTEWTVNTANPLVRSGSVSVERSTVAPWFGQPGGGVQYRFFDPSGEVYTMKGLINAGIIVPN